METPTALAALAETGGPLDPAGCAGLARRAAAHVEVAALPRTGRGDAVLLWRNRWSEAWLNTWWEARDTGYHDHDGSCVGVYVLAGEAVHEALAIGTRVLRRHVAGDAFGFTGEGIHRMDHGASCVTIHVYSPPLSVIGHYELDGGELRRRRLAADAPTPPSPALLAAVAAQAQAP